MDALSRHAFDTAIAVARADAPHVTRYALKVGDFYVGRHLHWETDIHCALTFRTMTLATWHAIQELGIGANDFTVETL